MNGYLASLAAGFFAAGFLVAVDLVVVFAVVFAGALAAGFLVASSLTPAFFAIAERALLRRAAVFFFSRFFLTAVSSSLWAAASVAALGSAMKALTADLMSRLIPILRSRRFKVCFARLMADLMIGIDFLYLYKFVSLIKDGLYRKTQ